MTREPQTTEKALQDRTDLRRIQTILNTSQVISRGGKFVAIEIKEANEIAALIERVLT